MWNRETAWRGRWRGDDVPDRQGAELVGDAYYAALGAEIRILQEQVERFLEAHADLAEEDIDQHIRAEIVRPHVLVYNRAAEVAREPRLPACAEHDLFSRLRRKHGLLAGLFDDPTITDIHIHGPGKPIWAKRQGQMQMVHLPLSKEEIMATIERWQAGASGTLTPLNWSIDVTESFARITAIHEHVALGGPAVSVRLRSATPLDGPALVERGMMPHVVWEYLRALFVDGAVSMVIGGRMSSGKTTLMQALLRALPSTCLVATIERPVELHVDSNVLQLVAHPPLPGDAEHTGEVTMRELVQRSLRLDVQRIVVGECRGIEALDMLAAMSLGHDGSITTVHGNNPQEILNRLALLCMYAPERLSLEAIRQTIRDAVGFVVVVAPTSHGLRLVNVSAVDDVVSDRFVSTPMLVWEDDHLCGTGYELPERLQERILAAGVRLETVNPLLAALPRARRQEARRG